MLIIFPFYSVGIKNVFIEFSMQIQFNYNCTTLILYHLASRQSNWSQLLAQSNLFQYAKYRFYITDRNIVSHLNLETIVNIYVRTKIIESVSSTHLSSIFTKFLSSCSAKHQSLIYSLF